MWFGWRDLFQFIHIAYSINTKRHNEKAKVCPHLPIIILFIFFCIFFFRSPNLIIHLLVSVFCILSVQFRSVSLFQAMYFWVCCVSRFLLCIFYSLENCKWCRVDRMEFHRSQVTNANRVQSKRSDCYCVLHTGKKTLFLNLISQAKLNIYDLVEQNVNACRRSLRIDSRQIEMNMNKKKEY